MIQRRPKNCRLQLTGLLALMTLAALFGGAAAARPQKAAPSKQTIAEAGRRFASAQNLRTLRIPLRARRFTKNVSWTFDKLQGMGMRVDRSVPIFLDTTQEYALLRQTSTMLRGARKGSKAYAMRKKAVTRAFELHRKLYRLPRRMRAFSSIEGKEGKPELVFNLDSSFFLKADRLLPIVAHEMRHMRDIRRALTLKTFLAQPGLHDARPGTRQHQRKQRLQSKVDALMSSSKAETRAFNTQARALGKAGRPLGNWWQAPEGNQLDKIYPPERLNRALVKGYLQGIASSLSQKMQTSTSARRTVTRRYLAGYKAVLRSQATAYVATVRKDDQRDPGTMDRYTRNREQTLRKAGKVMDSGKPLTATSAFLIGQADAYSGNAPVPRANLLLDAR